MLFDFLWYTRGSVRIGSDASDASVMQAVAELLEEQRKPILRREENSVEFDVPLWKDFFNGPNWLALIIYDRGRFGMVKDSAGRSLRYELRSLHGFVWCVSLAVVAGTLVSLSEGIVFGAEIGGLVIAWLYGMNLLLAALRVPAKIRRTVKRA